MSRSTRPDTREHDERVAALDEDVRRTRQQLAETVAALAHAVDVPSRARETVNHAGHAVLEKADAAVGALPAPVEQGVRRGAAVVRRYPVPILASVAGAIAVLLVLLGRRS